MNPILDDANQTGQIRRRMQDANSLEEYANYAEQYVTVVSRLISRIAAVAPELLGDDLDPAMLAKLGEN